MKADGVWFCTIHAIANRAADKKQITECMAILKTCPDGIFIFGGDFNCPPAELQEYINGEAVREYAQYFAGCVMYNCGLPTQGKAPERNREPDYFISSAAFVNPPQLCKILAYEVEGAEEEYDESEEATSLNIKDMFVYSDHDMVGGSFDL